MACLQRVRPPGGALVAESLQVQAILLLGRVLRLLNLHRGCDSISSSQLHTCQPGDQESIHLGTYRLHLLLGDHCHIGHGCLHQQKGCGRLSPQRGCLLRCRACCASLHTEVRMNLKRNVQRAGMSAKMQGYMQS